MPTDNEPWLVRRNRHGGFAPANTEVVSSRAAHLIESYTKHELLQRLASRNLVPGYSEEEMRSTAEWLLN